MIAEQGAPVVASGWQDWDDTGPRTLESCASRRRKL